MRYTRASANASIRSWLGRQRLNEHIPVQDRCDLHSRMYLFAIYLPVFCGYLGFSGHCKVIAADSIGVRGSETPVIDQTCPSPPSSAHSTHCTISTMTDP